MPDTRQFRRLRYLRPTEVGPVIEAAPEGQADVRVTIWPGAPPRPRPPHPTLPAAIEERVQAGQLCWIEARPVGAVLTDLQLPLDSRTALYLAAHLADGLHALHSAGQAHGEAIAERVIVGLDSMPVWMGASVRPGSRETDRADFGRLVQRLTGAPWDDKGTDLATWAKLARQDASAAPSSPIDIGRLVRGASRPVPADAPVVALQAVLEAAQVDEVGVELGPEEGRGLLDRYGNDEGDSTEWTRERTGVLSGAETVEQRRLAFLSRVAASPYRHSPSRRYRALSADALQQFQHMLRDEPLTAIPMADQPLPTETPAPEVTATVARGLTASSAPLVLNERTVSGYEATEPGAPSADMTTTSGRVDPGPSAADPATTTFTESTVTPLRAPATGPTRGWPWAFGLLFVGIIAWGLIRVLFG